MLIFPPLGGDSKTVFANVGNAIPILHAVIRASRHRFFNFCTHFFSAAFCLYIPKMTIKIKQGLLKVHAYIKNIHCVQVSARHMRRDSYLEVKYVVVQTQQQIQGSQVLVHEQGKITTG